MVTPGQSFNYAENQAAGACWATWWPAMILVSPVTDSVSGNTDGYFAIDNSGRITLTAAGAAAGVESNDFETGLNIFTLGVEARDADGNWSVAENVTLNVTDVDESAPVVTAGQIAELCRESVGGLRDRCRGRLRQCRCDLLSVSVTAATATSLDGYYTIAANGQVQITAAGVAAGLENNDFETGLNSFSYGIEAGMRPVTGQRLRISR